MREILIVNDVHLGVQRVAGTTVKSAAALRAYLQARLKMLMMAHTSYDIIINGDLFDDFMVPMQDILEFYSTAAEWLDSTESMLHLVAGNHDLAKDSSKMSAFQFAAEVLSQRFPDQVNTVMQPELIREGVYVIPHVANQQLLNEAIDKLPPGVRAVFFHANYDNGFAARSDHSLNVSEEQAARICRGAWAIFGHEHQARHALNGSLVVTGNQWPSSIADCLNNPGDLKSAHILYPDFSLSSAGATWRAADTFLDIDWQELLLSEINNRLLFIRVSGAAKAEQASDVIAAISKLRQSHDALVISNAVQIEGLQDLEDLPASVEVTKSFDVMGYLLEQLTPEQQKVVKSLLAKQEAHAA